VVGNEEVEEVIAVLSLEGVEAIATGWLTSTEQLLTRRAKKRVH
jgi:hypothetical protein